MAIHLIKANALLVEPIRCGTTWIQHALRAAGIETQQPETVGECCVRHSWPHKYQGNFDAVICPVRDPESWAISFYDFFRSRPKEVWQPNRFYAQKCFGHMPDTFEQFIEVACFHVRDYWEGFLLPATHVVRQENLCEELTEVLLELGYATSDLVRMRRVPEQNTLEHTSDWSTVDPELVAEFSDETQWIREAHYEPLAGHGGQAGRQGSAGSEAVEPVASDAG